MNTIGICIRINCPKWISEYLNQSLKSGYRNTESAFSDYSIWILSESVFESIAQNEYQNICINSAKSEFRSIGISIRINCPNEYQNIWINVPNRNIGISESASKSMHQMNIRIFESISPIGIPEYRNQHWFIESMNQNEYQNIIRIISYPNKYNYVNLFLAIQFSKHISNTLRTIFDFLIHKCVLYGCQFDSSIKQNNELSQMWLG